MSAPCSFSPAVAGINAGLSAFLSEEAARYFELRTGSGQRIFTEAVSHAWVSVRLEWTGISTLLTLTAKGEGQDVMCMHHSLLVAGLATNQGYRHLRPVHAGPSGLRYEASLTEAEITPGLELSLQPCLPPHKLMSPDGGR